MPDRRPTGSRYARHEVQEWPHGLVIFSASESRGSVIAQTLSKISASSNPLDFRTVSTLEELENVCFQAPCGVIVDTDDRRELELALATVHSFDHLRPRLAISSGPGSDTVRAGVEYGCEVVIFDDLQAQEDELLRSWAHAVHCAYVTADLLGAEDLSQPILKLPAAGYWRFDYGTEKLALSRGCYALFGRSRDEIDKTREGIFNYIHPQDRQRAQVIEHDEDQYDVRIIWPDGQVRHAWVIAFVAYDSTGARASVQGLLFDVTESKHSLKRASEAHRVYNSLFTASPAALLENDFSEFFELIETWRSDGIEDLSMALRDKDERLTALARAIRVKRANAAALELIGIERVEDIRDLRLFEQSDSLNAIKLFGEAFWRKDVLFRRELFQTNSRGRRSRIVFAMRIPTNGTEALSVPVALHDVTDTYRAEDMRKASIAKSEFLANMSHEIRSPLNAVIGHLELLAQEQLPLEAADHATRAYGAANTLLELVGEILDYSKIEAGELALDESDVNIDLLIIETLDMLQSKAREKGIFVTANIDGNVPGWIRADSLRLKQILINVISNAIKFTSHGGIHLSTFSQKDQSRKLSLCFAVHDSGKGIDAGNLDHIFETFQQEDGTITRRHGGTGLGLSIARKLCHAMDGDIHVDSQVGSGTTFTIELPLAGPSRDYEAPDRDPPRTIVLIRDQSEAALALRDIFETAGCTVLDAKDAEAALSLCGAGGSEAPSAVVTCEGEGWTPTPSFTEKVRRMGAMPMHLLSGRRTNHKIRAGLKAGLMQFFSSPVDTESVLRTWNATTGITAEDRVTIDAGALSLSEAVEAADAQVLVVEDRATNRDIISRQLNKLSVPYVLADDGRSGLDKLTSGKFALVLCDLSMPNISGYEFTRLVRRSGIESIHGEPIPIIAMTANVFRDDIEKTKEAGMNDFLPKPVTLPALSKTLAAWLSPQTDGGDEAESRGTVDNKAAPARDDPSRPSDANQPIDLDRLSDLIGDSDPSTHLAILSDFAEAMKASWSDVCAAIDSGEARNIEAAAHGAKGEARSAAAFRLASLYEDLEKGARANDGNKRAKAFEALAQEVSRTEVFINSLSNSGGM